jgi:competence protein ComEC
MAERGRAQDRAQAWAPAGASGRAGRRFQLPDSVAAIIRATAERPGAWLQAELAAGRLVPWLPVAFGAGIAVYFAAAREPAWWAAVALLTATVAFAVVVRRRAVGFPLAVALVAATAGFAVVTIKTATIAHPVLKFPASNVTIAGFVEVREERARTDRIVVRMHRLDASRIADEPERVRLSVRKGTAPPVGTFVELKARLNPPLTPLRPGGYDFARDLYFQRIGASGFVLGAIKVTEPPLPPGFSLTVAASIQGIRDAIDARIRAAVPGDAGAIASALITGKRDAISMPVNDAMYVSSLAHVLSISGYHMAIVAGVIFFVLRALFALASALANERPIKKWAAVGALAGAAFYLVLSGAEVATQRSFIMVAIVLVGVMLDRPALTLRTLTVAALMVMLIAPQSVVHPSFQMSFAATLALIAVYERGALWQTAGVDTSLRARVALWGGHRLASLMLASLVAGLATMPYAAYHFHRLAPYGVLANLLAMPIVSAWVMPTGLLALAIMPFGFDAELWRLMGAGIEWMIAVALWVASLPGAVGRIAAFGTGPLLLGTLGIVVICLLKTPLRWAGVVLASVASLWAIATPRPDILVAADARAVAVRTASGTLSIAATGGDMFAIRAWLAADGDARAPNDSGLSDGVTCDAVGCMARLADGRLAAHARAPEAFAEDCGRAAIVITAREAPPGCNAVVIDRKMWRPSGAIAVYRRGATFTLEPTRPPGSDRPWARAAVVSEGIAGRPVGRPATRDATPRLEDREAGD